MGVPLFEAGPDEQVITVEVDVDALRQWRDYFPALRDMRHGMIESS